MFTLMSHFLHLDLFHHIIGKSGGSRSNPQLHTLWPNDLIPAKLFQLFTDWDKTDDETTFKCKVDSCQRGVQSEVMGN